MAGIKLTLGSNALISPMSARKNTLWEPIWGIKTELSPVEIELIECPILRRLHFVHHGGPSYINTYITHSRLQHTFSVFSLIAHFCPDNAHLRVAALLHDVGHPPFSHSLEQIEGIDHHHLTDKNILSDQIRSILVRHQIDPKVVLDYINGAIPSPLRNRDNLLSIDYLDNFNFIRAAYLDSKITASPSEVLERLRLNDIYIETDLETAELLTDIIVMVNRWVCSQPNLGPNTVLTNLVQRLVANNVVTPTKLSSMADSQIEHILFKNPLTSQEAYRLWYYPQEIQIDKYEGGPIPENAYLNEIKKLYLAMPLVDGKPITEISEKAKAMIEETNQLIGKYIVYWAE